MLRISQALLKSLETVEHKGWFHYRELEETLHGKEKAFYTLLEGYAIGLYKIKGEDTFEIREEGRRLLEAWRKAGKPEADPWIDSRIATMLRTLQYSTRIPGEWKAILADRGLITSEDHTLTEAGETIINLMRRLERNLVITKSMARELAKAPEGPAEKELYGRFQPVYEAMGLLAATVPYAGRYSLTGAGRLLARAMRRLNLDAPLPSIVNPPVITALEKAARREELTPEEKTLLGTLGYLKATGSLDYPGRLVLQALEQLRRPRLNPPMALSRREENVLKAVVKAWKESLEKPNLIPGKELIAARYQEETGESIENAILGIDLLHLESMGLIEETSKDGKQAFKPTRPGEELATAPGAGSGATVRAVKTITYPEAGLGPSIKWVEKAVEERLVGVGGPTARGSLLARLSSTPRRPLLTRLEAEALRRIPEEKSIGLDALSSSITGAGGDPEEVASRLEARGLIEVLPDDMIILTPAGRVLKVALIGVPSGIAVPVSPVLVRVLRAVEELGGDDPARIVNETGLSLGTVRDMLVLARQARYLGRSGLTGAGRALLEVLDKINNILE